MDLCVGNIYIYIPEVKGILTSDTRYHDGSWI